MLCVSKHIKFVVDNPSVEVEKDSDMLSAEIFEELSEDFSTASGKYLIQN